jgi:multidrug efflux pump subunit AcrA (membrane-fusion protein)
MIADTNLEVEVDVPFARVGGLEVGAELRVSFADGHVSTATVRAVVPDENPLTRTRAVRLTPASGDDERRYTPGESVTVRVPLGEARQVVTVHKDAVIPQALGAIVFVVVDGKAEPRRVMLGEGVGERLEVLDGLRVGEQTVTRGNERLRPGQELNVESGAS